MSRAQRPPRGEETPAALPNFYTAVYRLVIQIPPGRVATYGQIASLLGHPSAARAVGYALHALPIGSSIPWQRVINAAGRISTRCEPHAEAIQRTLLESEGICFDAAASVDLRTFRWSGPSPGEPCHRDEPPTAKPPCAFLLVPARRRRN